MPFPWQNSQMRNPNTLFEQQSFKNIFFNQAQNPMATLLSKPTAAFLKNQFEFAVENLGNQAKRVMQLCNSTLLPPPYEIPRFARISPVNAGSQGRAMLVEAVEERLSGVPVYALSNAAGEFVLVSGTRTGKSLGLLCFKKEDAEALLDTMKLVNHEIGEGSKVVAIALNKVFQLNVDGIAFRLIPDPNQILNAAKLNEKLGKAAADFPGVPVFQSRTLALRSQGKSYRPAFFRKEDLEASLLKVSHEQKQLNPSLRKGNIEVSVLEEIISAMKGSSTSHWDDIVFIPPGFDVAAVATVTGEETTSRT